MTQTEQDHARKKDVCKKMCEYLNVEIEKDPSVMQDKDVQEYFFKEMQLYKQVLTDYLPLVRHLF